MGNYKERYEKLSQNKAFMECYENCSIGETINIDEEE